MSDRYSLNFDNLVWANMRRSIRSAGTNSIWYKTLHVVFKFFSLSFLPLSNKIYEQGFAQSMDMDSLTLEAKDYGFSREPGESKDDFLARYYQERLLREADVSISTIKAIFMQILSVEAEIKDEKSFVPFKIGVTPLGNKAFIYSSDYFRFVFEVYLPDLSSHEFNMRKVTSLIDEFSPNNAYRIFERRDNGLYEWEGL